MRNRTVREYTRWKYGRSEEAGPRGALARVDGRAVGCFGLISRTLSLANGRTVPCSWFADWYVVPTARGAGVGSALLAALPELAGLIIGHPGPAEAQAICRAAGYRPIEFQARRRFVLSRRRYERSRTRYEVKAIARCIGGAAHSALNRLSSPWGRGHESDQGGAIFIGVDEHAQWVREQPVAPHVTRTAGAWTNGELHVEYFDDDEGGPGRRLILYGRGQGESAVSCWRTFLEETGRAGRCFVDAFTTNPDLDRTWARLGGVIRPEPAILILANKNSCVELRLHGWDRENWTYAASSRVDDPPLALETSERSP